MNSSGKTIYNGWAFRLIIINVAIFVVQVFAQQYRVTYNFQGVAREGPSVITLYLGLIPAMIAEKGFIWQVFSYMFLHDTYSFAHLFFNMYALLIFGIPVEHAWGSRKFLFYYLFCGTFAGITIFLINLINQGLGYYIPTIGASGAVFGLLLAFGMLFPDAELFLFFIVPVKAKYLVVLYGGLELFLGFTGDSSSISHIGHLGGLAAGLLYFFFIKRRTIEFKYKINKALKAGKISKDNPAAKTQRERMDINDTNLQIGILKKLKDSGPESLSDDEIQYIKFIEIMSEDFDKDTLCNEADLDIEDERCNDCENFKVCFLREAKKYL